jgi:hypothetical protein
VRGTFRGLLGKHLRVVGGTYARRRNMALVRGVGGVMKGALYRSRFVVRYRGLRLVEKVELIGLIALLSAACTVEVIGLACGRTPRRA